ncbi:PAS domain-containing protein [Sphingomonas sp. KR3-1]|uniref:PAS domain-containing protein n=1 Tax=Sphingomonas sp. KR3-1 TaxID=3156611 RepID=UPI0032B33FA8
MTGAFIAQCITNLELQILEADARFTDAVQRDEEELRAFNILQLTHEEDRVTNARHIENLQLYREPFVIVKRYVRADGSVCWVRNHVSCTSNGAGGTVYLATVELIEPPEEGERALVGVAKRMLKRRELRCIRFGEDIFSEVAADILIDLFVSEHMSRDVYVSSACLASHVPPSTALRHLALLEERGLVARVADPFDKRRFMLGLTPCGRDKVIALLEAVKRTEAI